MLDKPQIIGEKPLKLAVYCRKNSQMTYFCVPKEAAPQLLHGSQYLLTIERVI